MIEKIVFAFCKYFCKEKRIEIHHNPNKYSVEFGWHLFGHWVSNGVYTIYTDTDDIVDTDLVWEDISFLHKCVKSGYSLENSVKITKVDVNW